MRVSLLLTTVACLVSVFSATSRGAEAAAKKVDLWSRAMVPSAQIVMSIDVAQCRESPIGKALYSHSERSAPPEQKQQMEQFQKQCEQILSATTGLATEDIIECRISVRMGKFEELKKLDGVPPEGLPVDLIDGVAMLRLAKPVTLAQLEKLANEMRKPMTDIPGAPQELQSGVVERQTHKGHEFLCVKMKNNAAVDSQPAPVLGISVAEEGKAVLVCSSNSLKTALDRIDAGTPSALEPGVGELLASFSDGPRKARMAFGIPEGLIPPADPNEAAGAGMSPMAVAGQKIRDIKSVGVEATFSEALDLKVIARFSNPEAASIISMMTQNMIAVGKAGMAMNSPGGTTPAMLDKLTVAVSPDAPKQVVLTTQITVQDIKDIEERMAKETAGRQNVSQQMGGTDGDAEGDDDDDDDDAPVEKEGKADAADAAAK